MANVALTVAWLLAAGRIVGKNREGKCMKPENLANVSEVITRRKAFYEVLPYYVLYEERLPDRVVTTRRIHAGFDIEVYGNVAVSELGRSPDRELAFTVLRDIAEAVASHSGDSCSIEVILFDSTLILDHRRKFQPEGMMRIRITHARGLDQPAAEAEEKALKGIVTQLNDLGISSGNSRRT